MFPSALRLPLDLGLFVQVWECIHPHLCSIFFYKMLLKNEDGEALPLCEASMHTVVGT